MKTRIPKSDHKRASLTLYYVIARNTEGKKGRTINKIGAALTLAALLQIDRRSPMAWLRGDFTRHPLSRENFLKIIRFYRTKSGLEGPREITALAISIYGPDYKRAIELLDPADRESDLEQEVMYKLRGRSRDVAEIYSLLESNPEAIEIAFGAMTTHQWTAQVLLEKLQNVPVEIESGMDKIVHVVFLQFPDNLREAFSKLGGLPELVVYNLACFETLLERTDRELFEMLSFFEKLNLIRAAGENEWKIKPQILDIAKQYLNALPKDIQMRAHGWWRSILVTTKYHETFHAHFAIRHVELEKIGNNGCVDDLRDKKDKSTPKRLKEWILARVEADWECMQSFSRYMSLDNFVFAQFILMRRKRNLVLGLALSLWFGAIPLLRQLHLVMGCAISVGVYALFRLLIDLHRCDTAWAGLWDTLMTKAASKDEEE